MIKENLPPEEECLMLACSDMLRRMGATKIYVQHDKLEDNENEPEIIIWSAVAKFEHPSFERPPQVDAAMDPVRAIYKLTQSLMDGGLCTHCHRPTALLAPGENRLEQIDLLCYYELKGTKFIRGCIGQTIAGVPDNDADQMS